MPRPDRIPSKQRKNIIGSYRSRLEEPDLDQEIKDGLIKLSTFDNQEELYQEQLREMRQAQRDAWDAAQVEIDKIQREFELVRGGVFYVEDLVLTRHYYLIDQGNNGNGQGGGNR